MIEFQRPGRLDYAEASALQRRIRAGEAGHTLLLLEHPPVITVTRRADPGHVISPDPIPVVPTGRGGDVTYHGPGQPTAYGLFDLQRLGIKARDYLTWLEEVMIRVCAGHGVEAGRRAGLTGAWVCDEKIGAIGVRVEHWITLHGFALNVDPGLSAFARIVPCGIADKGVTSLRKILGRAVSWDEVADARNSCSVRPNPDRGWGTPTAERRSIRFHSSAPPSLLESTRADWEAAESMAIADWLVRKKLTTLAMEDQRFAFVVLGKHVLCPYCLKALPLADKPGPTVVEHCLSSCEVFRGVESPLHPYPTLQRKGRSIEMRAKMAKDPAWRVFDSAGSWFCPFCAALTRVKSTGPKGDAGELAREMAKHLNSCVPYIEKKPQRPLEELRAAAERIRLEEKLVAQVSARMAADPRRWIHRSGDHWICPYCLKIQESINVGSEMLVKHTVPIQIAQHLITKCPKGTKDGKLRALEAPKPAAAATARPAIPAPKRPPAVVSIESAPQAVAAEATSKNAADRTARKPRTMIHMPASTPTDIPGYTFATHFGSHAEIPKDFCDFISLGGGQLGVVIADVSTAGIEGALVMSMARKVISLNARLSGDPREVLIKTNAELFPDLGRKICVSCTYGLLDPESHRYTCARAGHNFVLVYRATSKEVEIVRSNGMSLGLDGGTMFERVIQEATVDVGPGDTIFEYNYGLTETSNDQREEFGAERLTAVIQRYGRYEVGDLVRKVAGAVAEFAGGASRRNDELLLAIRRD